jgi:hypothetical protein
MPACLLLAIGTLLNPVAFCADSSGGIVAVYASVSPAYERTALPDGSFEPETYAFGEGGGWGGLRKDATIDQLKFLDIARLIAPSLAAKNYLPRPAEDPNMTDLLIMVYWGTTSGANGAAASEYQIAHSLIPPPLMISPAVSPAAGSGASLAGVGAAASCETCGNWRGHRPVSGEHQQIAVLSDARESALEQSWMMTHVANQQRDRRNLNNAAILGYLPEMNRVADYQMTALHQIQQDIIDDVEESRYFVVLLAYDFPTLCKHQQRKLLWETRFSIRERGNDFGKELGTMARFASRYFGKDSAGLIRKPLPEVRIIIGDPKFIGYEPETKG